MLAALAAPAALVALATVGALVAVVALVGPATLVALLALGSVFPVDLTTGRLLGTRHGLMLVLAVLVEALAAVGSTTTRAALLARAGDLLLVRGDFLAVGRLSLTRSSLPKAVAVDVVMELDALAATIELPRPATDDALVLPDVVAATLLTLSIAVASLALAVSALLIETARFFAFLVTAPCCRGVDFSMIEKNVEEIDICGVCIFIVYA